MALIFTAELIDRESSHPKPRDQEIADVKSNCWEQHTEKSARVRGNDTMHSMNEAGVTGLYGGTRILGRHRIRPFPAANDWTRVRSAQGYPHPGTKELHRYFATLTRALRARIPGSTGP
jgi:hypothetical protein